MIPQIEVDRWGNPIAIRCSLIAVRKREPPLTLLFTPLCVQPFLSSHLYYIHIIHDKGLNCLCWCDAVRNGVCVIIRYGVQNRSALVNRKRGEMKRVNNHWLNKRVARVQLERYRFTIYDFLHIISSRRKNTQRRVVFFAAILVDSFFPSCSSDVKERDGFYVCSFLYDYRMMTKKHTKWFLTCVDCVSK